MKPSTREFLAAARAAEPTLDAATRERLRGRVLGATAVGVGAAAALTGTAKAAGSLAPGAMAATATLWKGVVAVALIATAAGTTIALSSTSPKKPVDAAPAHTTEPNAGERRERTAPVPPAVPHLEAEDDHAVPTTISSNGDEQRLDPPMPAHTGRGAAASTATPPSPPVAAAAKSSNPSQASATPLAAPLTTETATHSFDAELRSLDRARAAITAGNYALALAETSQVSTTSPFSEERSALRVTALCKSGRSDEGNRALERFRARYPRSVHLERASRACAH